MTTGISNVTPSDYSSSLPSTAANSSEVSKDEFLKLLTYQLKSQNPLQPYNNQEFAAQLAQFSQLEQLTDIRSLMEEQVQTNFLLSQTISNSALPGMLGKTAKAMSNYVQFDGSEPVTMGYELPYEAAKAEVQITDSFGNLVRTIELSGEELQRGDHKFNWNGENNSGDTVPSGNYNYKVKAYDATGNSYSADSFAFGEIQAVRFKSEGTMLVINGMEIPLENVVDISTGG